MKSVSSIVPMKTLMPVISCPGHENTLDEVITANKMIAELHDYIQMNIPGSRERALVLTKIEETQHWLVATQAV